MPRAERRQPLLSLVKKRFPDLDDPLEAIQSNHVEVDGFIISNPRSMVFPSSRIALTEARPLKGTMKLRRILEEFGVGRLDGLVGLDLGASTGGFTIALLDRGAARVYAVDAGHGQLLGSLRQDRRVVNLEAVNAADLNRSLVPEPINILVADISYTPLSAVIDQVSPRIDFSDQALLVGLIKPMFELQLARLPTSESQFRESVSIAVTGIEKAGWQIVDKIQSPLRGNRGAVEFAVHARWRPQAAPR